MAHPTRMVWNQAAPLTSTHRQAHDKYIYFFTVAFIWLVSQSEECVELVRLTHQNKHSNIYIL